ncbi:uncharacterized protein LOC135197984 isoform X2 [Macrobrachium nipponense]|uniref:uncharacterized protein LOC135197984 isoform X2 n=1 Tax=Macrobrachium nipponense TaxID=159736 RepID=UPI0030C7DF5F
MTSRLKAAKLPKSHLQRHVTKALCVMVVVSPTAAALGGRGAEGESLRLASAKGDIAKVQALLREGVTVNHTDEYGYTALQRAASEGHLEIVRLLIKQKSNVDHQDDQHGNTALHEAAWKGYSQTAEALVRAKANVYIKNKGGFAPLHLACQNSHNQTSRILLLAGCKPDIKNNYGDTPLHTAARYGHAGVSRILISGKASVNEVNKNNDTALHIAVAMNRKKLTKILLESSANQKIRNKQNETPVDIALRKGFDQIAETLRNPPPVVSHEERVRQEQEQKKKEIKEVTFKDFVDEGKADKKGDKKREKANGSGSSSKESSTKAKDKKKAKHDSQEKPRGRHVSWSPYGCQYFPPATTQELAAPNLDSLPRDPLGAGEQYYIDLAGNIRKGPLGVGNSCLCTPFVKDVENKLEKDRFALLDRIEAANLKLDAKISELERLTKAQVHHATKVKEGRSSAEVSSSSQTGESMNHRAEQLRQWAEHQLAISSSFLYTQIPKGYAIPGPSRRSRDQGSGIVPITRSWSEEAVSEYKEDCESGRFSSYKGLKVLDHPTSMYNITQSRHDDDDVLSEYRKPIASLVPGSWRCASPDGCQSRITEDGWRLTPMSKRRESRRNSIDSSELLDDPYGPFKFRSEMKLLAVFPPTPDLVKESTDSGASSERDTRKIDSRARSSSLSHSPRIIESQHTSPVSHGSHPSKMGPRTNGNMRLFPHEIRKESDRPRVESGAIPKSNVPYNMTNLDDFGGGKRKLHQGHSYYNQHPLQRSNATVHGSQTTLVSEYNYNRMNFKMHQRYNPPIDKGQAEGIYESYSRPPQGKPEMETELDLDRKKMQQVAQRLYDGYFARGHLEPVRRPGRPPVSPFKERDSQNDSGYSARLSSSSSQEPSPTFSG